MRDIKFRAWDKRKRIMVYRNENESADYWDGVLGSEIEMINALLNDSSYEFMQYTGLHDRNGREIYEGDIIEEYDDGLYHWVVKWDNECACFYLHEQNIGEKFCLDDLVSVVNKGKVIGNIFQEGDLLDSEISKVDRD